MACEDGAIDCRLICKPKNTKDCQQLPEAKYELKNTFFCEPLEGAPPCKRPDFGILALRTETTFLLS